MQNESYSAAVHGGFAMTATAAVSSPLKSQYQSEGAGFTSLFSSNPSLPSAVSFTPFSDSDTQRTTKAIQESIYQSHRTNQRQELVNRHHLCLTHLREAAREADVLRQENTTLRSFNRELNKHIQASVQNRIISYRTCTEPLEVANAFRSLCIGNEGGDGGHYSNGDKVKDMSPTNVVDSGKIDGTDVQRTSLPKSISVRSNVYLKISQAGGVRPHGSRTRPRTASPHGRMQKVYVQGGKKEEEPLELEVYNQGMFKTELCNKWQQTGTCPYSDHCQFAHGVEELRPVIRHPRYKTEVCKMVLSGDVCPYGHRCHFRHALTEEEKFMGSLKPSTIQMDR